MHGTAKKGPQAPRKRERDESNGVGFLAHTCTQLCVCGNPNEALVGTIRFDTILHTIVGRTDHSSSLKRPELSCSIGQQLVFIR